jgi:DNA-directed RNA polymerase subunit L
MTDLEDIKDSIEIPIIFKKYNYDIHIKEQENHQTNGLDASWLILLFSGKDLNIKIINSIRRACSENIPLYGISDNQITIKTNTTVAYNNDYMRLYLSILPVIGVDPDIYFLDEKYWNKETINYADPKRKKHPKEKKIEYYIDAHNNTSEIINITTNDLKMFVDGEEISPYNKKYPILLIKLRPNDKFECEMNASLGVGERHVIWSGVSNIFYDEIKNDFECLLTTESNQQFDEYTTLIRACKFLIKKYEDIKKDIEKKIKTKQIVPKKNINLRFEKENFTIGGPLNYELQSHENIETSLLTLPDNLINSIEINIIFFDNVKSPINAIIDCLNILINKFNHIGFLLNKIQK